MKTHINKFVIGWLATGVLCCGMVNVSAATLAYWEFESGSFLTDSSGNGHTLVNNGAAESTNVIAGGPGTGSALFNTGSSTYMSTAASMNLSGETELTIEWSMASTVGGSKYPWGHGTGTGSMKAFSGAALGGIANAVQPGQELTGGSLIYSGALMPGGLTGAVWNRYVMQIDSTDPTASGLKLFINEVDVGVFGSIGSVTAAGFLDATLHIGTRGELFGFFGGNIDNFRISSGILAPSQFLVPEPSTAALLGIGGMLILARRRSRRAS